MAVVADVSWIITCDKGGCFTSATHSGSAEAARTAARKAGWQIRSRVSVRCPEHPIGGRAL